MRRHKLDFEMQPSPRKLYPESLQEVVLPTPTTKGGVPLWDIIRERRSIRSYGRESMSLQQLAQLLWATQGITLRVREHGFRSAPSAGALYPIETYVLSNRVENLEPGLYHYDPSEASLQLLKQGDYGRLVARSALDQPMFEEAAAVFLWTAIIARSAWKYAERAYRYIYMDAGHIGQNLYLAAAGIGFGCCAAGAFYDEEINAFLEIDGREETAVYLAAVGKLH